MNIIKRAQKLLKDGQHKEAIKILEANPSYETAFEIARIYGVKEYEDVYSEEKSFNIIRDLSNKKYIPAKYRLGEIYVKGEFDKGLNYIEADSLFRSIANIDGDEKKKFFEYSTLACLQIGRLYDLGYIGEIDKREALRYYKRACENEGLTEAFFKVGELILAIDPSNYSESLSYLSKSNERDHKGSIRLSAKINIKLSKRYINKLIQMDKNSVDYRIVKQKLDRIDEDLL